MEQSRAAALGVSVAAAFAALSMVSTAGAQEKASPAVDQTLLLYAGAKDSARLPDGRIIHLVCMGKGSPVVILNAAPANWSANWVKVQPSIATKTKVCSWDSAWLGFSSASPKPQTSDNLTSDLEAALKADRIDGPYVVVGHSAGAYVSLLLADREPSKVVGMVLIDPSIPDSTAVLDRAAPAMSAWLNRSTPLIPWLEKCAAALDSGTVRRGSPDPDGCLQPPGWPPTWPVQLRAALDKKFAGGSPHEIAAGLKTYVSLLKAFDQDSKIVINPRRNYGNMPLIVLTRTEFGGPSDFPAAVYAEVPKLEAVWRRAHEAYAALSTRGVDRIVPDSMHDMADQKPQAVIDAVDEVVDEARHSERTQAAR